MAAPPALTRRYTIEDLELREDQGERVQGIPHAVSPDPASPDQLLAQRLGAPFLASLEGCATGAAPVTGNWWTSDTTVLSPNALAACSKRPLKGATATEMLGLISDVPSPSTARWDGTVMRARSWRVGVAPYVPLKPEDASAGHGALAEDDRRHERESHAGPVALDLGSCSRTLPLGAL
jgi:hypothetical protein